MRTILAIAALFAVAGVPLAVSAAEHHGLGYHAIQYRVAPADEYFGRQTESVLEIRNRLDAFDRRSGREMLQPGTAHALNDLQDAIRDWQRRYPHDPWLPRFMHSLLRDYQRAGEASTPESLEIIALLQNAYPGDDATTQSVAGIFGASEMPASELVMVTVQGMVVDAQSGVAEIASLPFSATGEGGSFSIADLPAGQLHVIVQPPRGSGYASYQGTVYGSTGDVDTGVIRLALE